ncbi:MAG: tRNA (adenosine(37)-N6)-dimethylallyltransferase MiaA [Bacteroidetes bacterium]|nr:tRNA (adenosine(37)-N6)-dimethylallyltransferase MiaA [Bacteroidota bacterium]
MSITNKTLIIVCGPTAVGKTKVALQLAQHFKTDIISVDSRQIYKELSIGTAKPDIEELALIQHHFINHISIHDDFSAGQYEVEVIALLGQLFEQNDVVIAAGGTGLYIKAITDGFDDIPAVNSSVRAQIINEYEQFGLAHLQREVKIADPEAYEKMDTENPQRLMRVLEVNRGSGQKVSSLQKHQKKDRNFRVIKIGINLPREMLYEQINGRVDLMMENGLLEEAKQFFDFRHLNALQTVGYNELYQYLNKEISLEEAIDLIKRNSRRYAKRQLTWLRKQEDIQWFAPQEGSRIIEYLVGEM